MKYTIDRSKWRRGFERLDVAEVGYTELLNEKGNMCCLGMIEEQRGCSRVRLLNAPNPASAHLCDRSDGGISEPGLLWALNERHAEEKYVDITQLTAAAMRINDDLYISDASREARLIELFAKHDVELVFEGEYLGGELKAILPELQVTP